MMKHSTYTALINLCYKCAGVFLPLLLFTLIINYKKYTTMAQPKAYEPVQGYQYQLLCRHPQYNGREWEHCDYATDKAERKHLLDNYRLAYGNGYQFKTIPLPRKYWKS